MDSVALVTGARVGIGHAIAEALEQDGYKTARLSRDIQAGVSGMRLSVSCDVSHPDEVDSAVSAVLEHFGRIDVLVNSAGISHLGTVDTLDPAVARSLFEVNVMGSLHVIQRVLPVMRGQGSGSIITIGSLRAKSVAAGKAAYCMSKHALRALSLTLGEELADQGIRITLINPGFTQTNLIRHRIAEEGLTESDLTQPADVAEAVRFALSLSPGAVLPEVDLGSIW